MNSKARLVYEFGPFQLEPAEYRLLRDGQPVLLTPKALKTLIVLIENAGHVVEKNELMKLVWADTIVEESTISQNIFTLRKVLGSNASGVPYIETVPKRGYRLAVPVRELYEGAGEQSTGAGTVAATLPDLEPAPEPLIPQRASRGPFSARRGLLVTAAGLTALFAVALGGSRFVRGSSSDPVDNVHREPIAITRLTNTGNSLGAAISSDGRFIAYIVTNVGQQGLRLRLVGTARDIELAPLAAERFQGVTFSRDGNWIYYVRDSTLFEVSVMGGPSRMLLKGMSSAVAVSPSGKQFAFIHGDAEAGESAVMIASASGGETAILAKRTVPEYFRSVAWAPGRDVIVATVGTRSGERYMTLTEIAVKTGIERPLTSHKWYAAREVAWLSDETGLILSASATPSEPFQLWKISYPDGNVTKITNDLDDYYTPSLTAASGDLVSSKRSDVFSVWVEGNATSQSQRVTEQGGLSERPSWTSDGRIVYESRVGGNRDVWIMDADGGHKKQLTFDAAADHSPSAAPTGADVYFVSDRIDGIPHIWKMGLDGSNPKQLTSGDGEGMPDCSPDGAWLAYESVSSGRPLLWRIPAGGGTPVQLTDRLSRAPAISPDGKLIAMYYWDEVRDSPIRVAVIPSTGGKPVKLFDFPEALPSRIVRWSADGRAINYVVTQNGISNIWSQPLEGGPPKPITHFGADVITFFDWSPSGKLAFSRRVRTEDVVLISTFR